ncbi:MAG TPA: porin [Vicinamibacterales bacterium]|nr:porin [Vicinamibacterales bacterium]
MPRRTPPLFVLACLPAILLSHDASAQSGNGVALGPLTLTAYVQIDAQFGLTGESFAENDTFRFRRARFALSGDLTDRIGWYASVEATAPSVPLRDVYVSFRMAPWMTARAGQFVTHFSLERQISTSRLEAIDRALQPLTPGRDVGVMLLSDRPLGGWFGYSAAVINGAGQNQVDDNDAKDVVGRVTMSPPASHNVRVGVNAATGAQPSGKRHRYGADVEIQAGGLRAMAEVIRQEHNGADALGLLLFAAHRTGPWELVGRASRLELDAAARWRLDAGGSYYFIGRTRLMMNVVYFPGTAERRLGVITRLQLAL